MSRFVEFLMNPEVITFNAFAEHWFDQEICYRFKLNGDIAPTVLATHLRRSFFPAVSAGASEEAKAGRPCSWDPPCALDIFMREQLRYKGQGLPKPFVIEVELQDGICIAKLRVFGAANDWFWLVAESFAKGIQDLPWQKRLNSRVPQLEEREYTVTQGISGAMEICNVILSSPLDISHLQGDVPIARSFFDRALYRIDGLARWHGFALSDIDTIRQLIKDAYFEESIERHSHYSPNSQRQARRKQVALGSVTLRDPREEIVTLAKLAARAHVGRGAVEGLGSVKVS